MDGPWLLGGVILLASACDKGSDSSGDESDADTDTDTDAFSAEVTYKWTVDGVVICDTLIELTGTESTGACPTCDWVFEVQGVVASEAGNISCFRHPALALGVTNPKGLFVDPVYFGHRIMGDEEFLHVQGTYQFYEDGLYYTDLAEPYALAGGSDPYGTFERTGDEVRWSWHLFDEDEIFRYNEEFALYQMCSWSTLFSTATEPYAATESDTSTLPCDNDYVDIWSFQGQAGSTAFVTVDALEDDYPMDPAAWIYGPHVCVEVYADDSFECTVGGYGCPSMAVLTEDGEYWVVVYNDYVPEDDSGIGEPKGCTDETVSYQIAIDATWTTGLTLRTDDISQYGTGSIQVEGTAHLPKGTP